TLRGGGDTILHDLVLVLMVVLEVSATVTVVQAV
ncbi:hypothetical protein A2U01_0113911, partial [Trifolium medium]|nr:hypothetical protein [Trifolium medium]